MGKDTKFGLVFFYGAGLGTWIWNNLSPLIDTPCLFLDYPGRNHDSESTKGLTINDYSDFISTKINNWHCDKIIIIAHSIGGIIALDALKKISPKLIGFVAISAAVPISGGSFLSPFSLTAKIIMKCLFRIFGTKPPQAAIKNGLCNDLTSEQADKVFRQFTPEALSIYEENISYIFPDVPKLYVKLTNDAAYSLQLQEKAIEHLKPETIMELNTGHLPMISKPNELVKIINEFTLKIDKT
jgi:pimeloyl-ACP methyl ester carboxylesterase